MLDVHSLVPMPGRGHLSHVMWFAPAGCYVLCVWFEHELRHCLRAFLVVLPREYMTTSNNTASQEDVTLHITKPALWSSSFINSANVSHTFTLSICVFVELPLPSVHLFSCRLHLSADSSNHWHGRFVNESFFWTGSF